MELIIGNKNYSSWSLRPWLLLKHFQVPFDETLIPLYQDDSAALLAQHSPSLKVPVLKDESLTVWDSLAICDYLNEHYLNGQALPTESTARAECRSFCAEMHSGFQHLRNDLPMNCRSSKHLELSADCFADIRRIDSLWQQALNTHEGPFLFGEFSLADCMFAPVASRFSTYDVKISALSQSYVTKILGLPAMLEWYASAAKEPYNIPASEVGDKSIKKLST